MSRTARLFDLLTILRRHRHPVPGAVLARECGVSLRTLYRDIATLQAQGARIDGEAGVGYLLRPGFLLPPLMFSAEEIEALVLGSRWVAERADSRLGQAASDALARIASVLPAPLREEIDASHLFVGPSTVPPTGDRELAAIRLAIREQRKLALHYEDLAGQRSRRRIWPFALAFFDRARVVVGWCELRRDFRTFRTDRIRALKPLAARYPRPRHELLAEWQEREQITPP